MESGTLRPTDDPYGRAVVLTVWDLGALVLHRHLQRLLGVDLTAPEVGVDPAIAAYAGPVYEIYGEGIFPDEFATRARAALATAGGAAKDRHVTSAIGSKDGS